MSRRRPPEPSSEDIRKWKTLIGVAQRQALAPLSYAGDLGKRAKSAAKAVMPPAHQVRGSVFARLVELGKVWAGLDRDQRVRRADELAGLADAVEQALSEGHGGRSRADLDG
ncbi:hypothetical protein [Caulobacter vibrioides]|uniref:hypothetical protein n=1 Tax=Caulobacter vibrioides TaxID=155892 RepID=UPI000BB48345|nr:hypothetical protein [Caulobacter vibrioides]ATC25192.1 hypothetical protein CA608_11970 [Caulobacter vibrioides]PLR13963.1 hypothetical protein CVUC_05275 [Caulobacter vibrioides]